jgi:hypothetical protein
MTCTEREPRISGQLFAKLIEIGRKLAGVTIPSSPERHWRHVIDRILDPFVQKLAEFLNGSLTSPLPSAPCHGPFKVFHNRPDRHTAEVSDFLPLLRNTERPKLQVGSLQDRMVFFEEERFTHNGF